MSLEYSLTYTNGSFIARGRPKNSKYDNYITGSGLSPADAVSDMERNFNKATEPSDISIEVCGETLNFSSEGELMFHLFGGPPADYYEDN